MLLLVTFTPQKGVAEGPTFETGAGQFMVLLAGGIDNVLVGQTHVLLATAELYDAKSGQFTATGSMSIGRAGHAATLLQNGHVLITGGDSELTNSPFNGAELLRHSQR
jgi:hypothetical protein